MYLEGNPFLPAVANWNGLAPYSYPGNQYIYAPVDTSVAEGNQFAQWLQFVDPAPGEGQVQLVNTYGDVPSVISPAQAWISGCSVRYPAMNSPYTPAGTYAVTVTATDGYLV